jgi:hypothetical protein
LPIATLDRRHYRIRFAPGQLPPVNAFWSVSLYGLDQYFVANPVNLYAVGHQLPVAAGPYGAAWQPPET